MTANLLHNSFFTAPIAVRKMSQSSNIKKKSGNSGSNRPRSNSTNTGVSSTISTAATGGSNRSKSLTVSNELSQMSGGGDSNQLETTVSDEQNVFVNQDESVVCGKCRDAIVDSHELSSIQCESCSKWHHLGCANLEESDMTTLKKCGIHWFCESCDSLFSGIDNKMRLLEEKIDKVLSHERSYAQVVSKIESNATFIKQLESTTTMINDHLGSTKSAMDNHFKNQEKQMHTIRSDLSKETRAKNLILFGVAEQSDTTLEQSMESVSELLRSCSLKHSVSKDNLTRLGQKKEDKPRPIRLSLSSQSEKWEFLKRINAQRVRGIFARCDLDKEERKKDFLLRQELKTKRLENPSQKFKIYKNRVMKIT